MWQGFFDAAFTGRREPQSPKAWSPASATAFSTLPGGRLAADRNRACHRCAPTFRIPKRVYISLDDDAHRARREVADAVPVTNLADAPDDHMVSGCGPSRRAGWPRETVPLRRPTGGEGHQGSRHLVTSVVCNR
jgi:hypothetical protein